MSNALATNAAMIDRTAWTKPFQPLKLMMESSALSLLAPGEACMLVLHDGRQCRGAWNPNLPGFHLAGERRDEVVFVQDVEEWWPVSVG